MAKRAMTEEAKEIKANQILDQAASWLLKMNYEKIKMSDLAKSMNMSNGILYVYFKTKETLFLCLLWREYEKRLSYLEKKQPVILSPVLVILKGSSWKNLDI